MCLISLYYVYKASRSCLLHFLCHPYILHYNLKNFLFTCLITIPNAADHIGASIQQSYKQQKRLHILGILTESVFHLLSVYSYKTSKDVVPLGLDVGCALVLNHVVGEDPSIFSV